MEIEKLSINGDWPELRNKRLDRLLAQEYWYKGILEEPANVVWLKVDGNWYRLYFDCGIIFWRTSDEEPSYSPPEPDGNYDYPLIDLATRFGLSGKKINECGGIAIKGGSQVVFKFVDQKIIFKNVDDITTIET